MLHSIAHPAIVGQARRDASRLRRGLPGATWTEGTSPFMAAHYEDRYWTSSDGLNLHYRNLSRPGKRCGIAGAVPAWTDPAMPVISPGWPRTCARVTG